MDDYRQQQMDVLKEAVPYSEKLIGAIEKVSDELAGVPFPETHDAVNVIIEGLRIGEYTVSEVANRNVCLKK